MAKVGIKKAENKKKVLPFTTDYHTPKYPVVRLKDVESFTEEEAIDRIYNKINDGEGIRAIRGVVNSFYNNYTRKARAIDNEEGIRIVKNLIVEEMETGAITNFGMLLDYFVRGVNDPMVTDKRLSAALRELVEEGYLIKKRLVNQALTDTYEIWGYGECYIRTAKL
jgi:hypothetical protein